MTPCPDLPALLADADTGVDGADARLEQHLDTCAVCAAETADLADALAGLRAPVCPPEVVTRALQTARRSDRPPAAPPRNPRARVWARMSRAAGLGAALLVGLAVWTTANPGGTGLPGSPPADTLRAADGRPSEDPRPAPQAVAAPPAAPPLVASAAPSAADPPPRPARREIRSARTYARTAPARPAPARRTPRPAPAAEAVDPAEVARAQAELELALGIVGRAQSIATETISTETRRVGDALRETRVF